MKALHKKLYQLAGEHAVMAELSLRGLLTVHLIEGFPQWDILAYNFKLGRIIKIQVKTGRGHWKIGYAKESGEGKYTIEGFAESSDFYILVDLIRERNNNFDFYILPTDELFHILERFAPQKYSRRKKGKHPCWINKFLSSHSAEWNAIRVFKNKWNLLFE